MLPVVPWSVPGSAPKIDLQPHPIDSSVSAFGGSQAWLQVLGQVAARTIGSQPRTFTKISEVVQPSCTNPLYDLLYLAGQVDKSSPNSVGHRTTVSGPFLIFGAL